MTSLLPSEVLSRAADLIEPEGCWTTDHSWSDGTTGDDRLGFCIFDALIKAHPQGKMINGWEAVNVPVRLSGAATSTFYRQQMVYGRSILASWNTMREPFCGALGKYLHEAIPALPGYPHGLVTWNDAPDRTQSEVVSALRAASELARREGK